MGSCLSSNKTEEARKSESAYTRTEPSANQGSNPASQQPANADPAVSPTKRTPSGLGSSGGPASPASPGAGQVGFGSRLESKRITDTASLTRSSTTNSGTKPPTKILLLGSGESGKSTIVKQMKIIHQNGYSQEECLMYKTTVYKNLVDCAKAVVDAMVKLGINIESDRVSEDEMVDAHDTFDSSSETSHANAVTQNDLDLIRGSIVSPDADAVLDLDLAHAIDRLWHRPEIKKLVSQRRSEFYLMDSAPYLFNNIERIADPEYIPTVNDILRARIKTTGIYETRFNMGGLDILMYDVGGQRSERRKWIHCFDNVTLLIFCVALSEYDQVLLEEKGQNRMAESLVLFDSIINSPWFARTSVVLFLNKIDVFTEKLPYSPLENYFPDYEGGNDVNKAVKYILWRFTQANRSGLNIYPHLTQATDTSNITLVFGAVKETILQNALKDSGIL